METVEESPEPFTGQPLIISEESKLYLVQAGKWATFLGIIGFVFIGLLTIAIISMGIYISNIQRDPMADIVPLMNLLFVIMAIVYFIVATVTFFFSFYLCKFGTTVKAGVLYNDAFKTNAAFSKLKSFFKLSGVTTVVVLILYALMFLFVIFGGLTMDWLKGNCSFHASSPLVP